METRKRDVKGRFIGNVDENFEESNSIKSTWNFKRIFYFLIMFLVISPWVSLLKRNGGLHSLSQRILEFYEENFNCPKALVCDGNSFEKLYKIKEI